MNPTTTVTSSSSSSSFSTTLDQEPKYLLHDKVYAPDKSNQLYLAVIRKRKKQDSPSQEEIHGTLQNSNIPLNSNVQNSGWMYYVHFCGYNDRYDRWVSEEEIFPMGYLTHPTPTWNPPSSGRRKQNGDTRTSRTERKQVITPPKKKVHVETITPNTNVPLPKPMVHSSDRSTHPKQESDSDTKCRAILDTHSIHKHKHKPKYKLQDCIFAPDVKTGVFYRANICHIVESNTTPSHGTTTLDIPTTTVSTIPPKTETHLLSKSKSHYQYFVHFYGFNKRHDTWIPEEDLRTEIYTLDTMKNFIPPIHKSHAGKTPSLLPPQEKKKTIQRKEMNKIKMELIPPPTEMKKSLLPNVLGEKKELMVPPDETTTTFVSTLSLNHDPTKENEKEKVKKEIQQQQEEEEHEEQQQEEEEEKLCLTRRNNHKSTPTTTTTTRRNMKTKSCEKTQTWNIVPTTGDDLTNTTQDTTISSLIPIQKTIFQTKSKKSKGKKIKTQQPNKSNNCNNHLNRTNHNKKRKKEPQQKVSFQQILLSQESKTFLDSLKNRSKSTSGFRASWYRPTLEQFQSIPFEEYIRSTVMRIPLQDIDADDSYCSSSSCSSSDSSQNSNRKKSKKMRSERNSSTNRKETKDDSHSDQSLCCDGSSSLKTPLDMDNNDMEEIKKEPMTLQCEEQEKQRGPSNICVENDNNRNSEKESFDHYVNDTTKSRDDYNEEQKINVLSCSDEHEPSLLFASSFDQHMNENAIHEPTSVNIQHHRSTIESFGVLDTGQTHGCASLCSVNGDLILTYLPSPQMNLSPIQSVRVLDAGQSDDGAKSVSVNEDLILTFSPSSGRKDCTVLDTALHESSDANKESTPCQESHHEQQGTILDKCLLHLVEEQTMVITSTPSVVGPNTSLLEHMEHDASDSNVSKVFDKVVDGQVLEILPSTHHDQVSDPTKAEVQPLAETIAPAFIEPNASLLEHMEHDASDSNVSKVFDKVVDDQVLEILLSTHHDQVSDLTKAEVQPLAETIAPAFIEPNNSLLEHMEHDASDSNVSKVFDKVVDDQVLEILLSTHHDHVSDPTKAEVQPLAEAIAPAFVEPNASLLEHMEHDICDSNVSKVFDKVVDDQVLEIVPSTHHEHVSDVKNIASSALTLPLNPDSSMLNKNKYAIKRMGRDQLSNGMAKITPPKGWWNPSFPNQSTNNNDGSTSASDSWDMTGRGPLWQEGSPIGDMIIPSPIKQRIDGIGGVYEFTMLELPGTTVAKFRKSADEYKKRQLYTQNISQSCRKKGTDHPDVKESEIANHRTMKRKLSYTQNEQMDVQLDDDNPLQIQQEEDESDDTMDELARQYWRRLGPTMESSVYGADMQGTLFRKDEASGWNVDRLDSCLQLLRATYPWNTILTSNQDGKETDDSCGIPGVTSSYLYFGMWASTFAAHKEDMNLCSINYLHAGAPKYWYAINAEDTERFESLMASHFVTARSACSEYLRHKRYLISPTLLTKAGISYTTQVQRAGDIIITFPGCYHFGFNTGFNCAESTNFAVPEWIPIGQEAGVCLCHPHSVRIDMFTFKYLLDEYMDAMSDRNSKRISYAEWTKIYRRKQEEEEMKNGMHEDIASPGTCSPCRPQHPRNSMDDYDALPKGTSKLKKKSKGIIVEVYKTFRPNKRAKSKKASEEPLIVSEDRRIALIGGRSSFTPKTRVICYLPTLEHGAKYYSGVIVTCLEGYVRIHFEGYTRQDDVWLPWNSNSLFVDGGPA